MTGLVSNVRLTTVQADQLRQHMFWTDPYQPLSLSTMQSLLGLGLVAMVPSVGWRITLNGLTWLEANP